MRQWAEVDHALTLLAQGRTATEVAQATGIPRSTVRDWSHGRGLILPRQESCPQHDVALLDARAYAYLLGIYLGDGYLSRHARGVWRLRVSLDAKYPVIIAECSAAIRGVRGREAHAYRRRGQRCTDVSSYWKHWPCYLPQHGLGVKHCRPIVLTTWQREIVAAQVELFIRGLIHSDGTRIVATERKGRYVRRAARYAFSNRSEDILQLFWDACEKAGAHCTRASRKQIAVYSKAAVARLDEFVGPKC